MGDTTYVKEIQTSSGKTYRKGIDSRGNKYFRQLGEGGGTISEKSWAAAHSNQYEVTSTETEQNPEGNTYSKSVDQDETVGGFAGEVTGLDPNTISPNDSDKTQTLKSYMQNDGLQQRFPNEQQREAAARKAYQIVQDHLEAGGDRGRIAREIERDLGVKLNS